MTKFRITIEKSFHNTENVTALEWAEDYAYTIADKAEVCVKAIEDCPHCDNGVYLTPDDNIVDCEYCNGE